MVMHWGDAMDGWLLVLAGYGGDGGATSLPVLCCDWPALLCCIAMQGLISSPLMSSQLRMLVACLSTVDSKVMMMRCSGAMRWVDGCLAC